MKYLSVVVLLIVLVWTWILTTSDKTASLTDHAQVESNIRNTIESYIKAQKPEAQDIIFNQLYTETLVPEQELKVHFRYQIVTPQGGDTAEETFDGHVLLSWNEEEQAWKWSDEEVRPSSVNFRTGVRISPETSEAPAN